MQNLYGILLRWRSGGAGVPHLIKRAYTKKVKQGGRPCPPCEPTKIHLPQIAKTVREKKCNQCAYQLQRKYVTPFMPKEVKASKTKPCSTPQHDVDHCTERKIPPECPEGNWNNPRGDGK